MKDAVRDGLLFFALIAAVVAGVFLVGRLPDPLYNAGYAVFFFGTLGMLLWKGLARLLPTRTDQVRTRSSTAFPRSDKPLRGRSRDVFLRRKH